MPSLAKRTVKSGRQRRRAIAPRSSTTSPAPIRASSAWSARIGAGLVVELLGAIARRRWRPDFTVRFAKLGIHMDGDWYCSDACVAATAARRLLDARAQG